MNRKLRFLLTLILLFVSVATFIMAGCDGCNKGGEEDLPTLYFSEEGYSIDRYANLKLNAHYDGDDDVWTSSDENVAIVKDGVVLALNIGTTEITVSVGEVQAKCTLTVKATASYPSLYLSQESVAVLKGKTKTVSAELKVEGSEILDKSFVTYSFVSENSEIATVDANGTITGVAVGETVIEATANYANRVITEKINVQVMENADIMFEKSKLTIYTNSVGGLYEVEKTLNVYVYEQDQAVSTPSITWESKDENVVTVVGGVAKAVNAGETKVVASYVTTGGQEIKTEMTIVVEYPEIETGLELTVEILSNALTFDLSEYSSLFDTSMRDVEIVDDLGDEITAYINSGIVTVDNATLNYGFREFTVLINNEIEFLMDVEAITKIIRTPAELKNFAVEYGGREPVNSNDATGNYSGYFVLGNDIDMQGEKINTWCGHGAIFEIDNVNYGFKGIFDGKGHTVYNANSNIFGKVSVDGVIKNLGIYTDNFGDYGALATILSGTVENCYVRVSMLNQQPNVGAICYRAIGAVSLNNVVVDVVNYDKMAWFNKGTADEKFIEGHVATLIFGAGSVPEVSNVFVISPNKEDILCQNGSFKGTVNHFGRNDEKTFATLSTASGYWTDEGDVKVFKSAIGWNLTKLGVVSKDDFEYNTNGELSWTAVPNASGYTVIVDGVEYDTGVNSLEDVPNAGDAIFAVDEEKLSKLVAQERTKAQAQLLSSPSTPTAERWCRRWHTIGPMRG